MPGVYRPYTLTDVLGTIISTQSQAAQPVGSVTGVGFFAEAGEASMPLADSATATAQALPGWDQGVWGALSWS